MQEISVLVDFLLEADAPQRSRPPLASLRQPRDIVAVEVGSHIVQQKVAVRVDRLAREPRKPRAAYQRRSVGTRVERRHVTQVAAGAVKRLLALLDDRIVDVPARGNAQRVEIEVDVLHVVRRDLNAVVAVSEHLGLAFGHLQRIAVVRDAQIGRETELDGQVGVLSLVARNADILLASLGDVVQAARNAVFGIVALAAICFSISKSSAIICPMPTCRSGIRTSTIRSSAAMLSAYHSEIV